MAAKIPDRAEHQRRFAALTLPERRKIIKAVNRGKVVEERKHAVLAIGVARRQQRFWKWAWLVGPLVGVMQFLTMDPMAALLNAGVASMALGALAYYWYSRAKRAEELNTEVALRGGSPGRAGRSGGSSGGSSEGRRGPSQHLPGAARRRAANDARAAAEARGGDDEDDDRGDRARRGQAAPEPSVPGQRPYTPRGRKRRGKR